MTSLVNLNILPQGLTNILPSQNASSRGDVSPEILQQQDAIRVAANEFESAFITQMLTFSGLDKALTTGGGEAMSAFTGFYIESFAEQMTEAGGLGLAERFYTDLLETSGLANDLEASSTVHDTIIKENKNDELGLL